MATKATHKGTCQRCGSLQCLPNNVLAKHGYQVVGRGNCGFFAGTCCASGELPLEVSCDKVAQYAKAAERRADRLTELAAEALALTGTESWYHKYNKAEYRMPSYYSWVRCDYLTYDFDGGHDDAARFSAYLASDAKKGDQAGADKWTGYLAQEAAKGRQRRAEAFESDARHLRAYAASQREVVRTWAPQPLKPL